MRNSKIPIDFQLHCVDFTDDLNHRPGITPYEILYYFNSRSFDVFRKAKYSSDLIIVIAQDIGDRSAVSVADGLQYNKTVMIVDQEFIFDQYIFAHELGHIFGCGHEMNSGKSKI